MFPVYVGKTPIIEYMQLGIHPLNGGHDAKEDQAAYIIKKAKYFGCKAYRKGCIVGVEKDETTV